jgi:nucleoid DNA-binding protein
MLLRKLEKYKMAKVKKVKKTVKAAKESSTLGLWDFAKNLEVEDLSKAQIKTVLTEYFGAVQSTVLNGSLNPGDKISMPGLGALVCQQKKARNARNPATGETIKLDARPAVKFKLAGQLRIWGKPVKAPAAKAAKKAKKK